MILLRRLLNKYREIRDPVRYARQLGVAVGENCSLSCPGWGSEPWLISIGNHVQISGDVNLITHDGATWVFVDQERYRKVIRFGKIVINDNCFIGMRATIMPGVTIGPNSVVAAGSVVTRDVQPNTIVAGVPAREIGRVDEYAEKCLRETPDYDENAYYTNKRDEVLRVLGLRAFGNEEQISITPDQ